MMDMKTVYHSKSSLATRMLVFLMAAVALAAVSCNNDDNNDATTNTAPYTISGNASGSQMVPTVSGTGTGTMTGTYDPQTRTLNYTSNWSGLTGRPTAGGFYAGAAGTTDSTNVIIGSPWTFDSTAVANGTRSGTITLTPDQATALTSGSWYYRYGTKMNPGGEVRGQMTATQQGQTGNPAPR
jgi:hypothetical protein